MKKLWILLLTCCLSIGFTVTALGAVTESDSGSTDNNGSAKTADVIAPNTPINAQLFNSGLDRFDVVEDEDWFTTILTHEGYARVEFDVDQKASGEVHQGWIIRVYVNDVSSVYYTFNQRTGLGSRVETSADSHIFPIPKGSRVYVQVVPANPQRYSEASPTKPYSIQITNVSSDAWEKENNDSWEKATPAAVGKDMYGNSYSTNTYGDETISADADWYSMKVPSTGYYKLKMKVKDSSETDIKGGWSGSVYALKDGKCEFVSSVDGTKSYDYTLTKTESPEIKLEAGMKVAIGVCPKNKYGAPSNIDYVLQLVKTGSCPEKNGKSIKDTKLNGKFKVTSQGTEKKLPEMTFVAPINKNKTKVTVPKYVTYNGVKYKVTAVAANAFKNNKKVKTVIISENVTKIGKDAFRGCKRLKNITIRSKKIKSVGKNALKGVHSKCKIKVPKAKLSKYKKLFKNKGQKKTVKITK